MEFEREPISRESNEIEIFYGRVLTVVLDLAGNVLLVTRNIVKLGTYLVRYDLEVARIRYHS